MKLWSFTFITLPGMYRGGGGAARRAARFAAGVTADGARGVVAHMPGTRGRHRRRRGARARNARRAVR